MGHKFSSTSFYQIFVLSSKVFYFERSRRSKKSAPFSWLAKNFKMFAILSSNLRLSKPFSAFLNSGFFEFFLVHLRLSVFTISAYILKLCVDKENKTGVINDPFGQTYNLASNEYCFNWKLFCFARFWKLGKDGQKDGRTTCVNIVITIGRDSCWPRGSMRKPKWEVYGKHFNYNRLHNCSLIYVKLIF